MAPNAQQVFARVNYNQVVVFGLDVKLGGIDTFVSHRILTGKYASLYGNEILLSSRRIVIDSGPFRYPELSYDIPPFLNAVTINSWHQLFTNIITPRSKIAIIPDKSYLKDTSMLKYLGAYVESENHNCHVQFAAYNRI